MRRNIVPLTTSLYRHYDANGVLLYVGLALCPVKRLQDHRRTSPWFEDIVRIEIQKFPNRFEATQAETLAIKTEQPKYNTKQQLWWRGPCRPSVRPTPYE